MAGLPEPPSLDVDFGGDLAAEAPAAAPPPTARPVLPPIPAEPVAPTPRAGAHDSPTRPVPVAKPTTELRLEALEEVLAQGSEQALMLVKVQENLQRLFGAVEELREEATTGLVEVRQQVSQRGTAGGSGTGADSGGVTQELQLLAARLEDLDTHVLRAEKRQARIVLLGALQLIALLALLAFVAFSGGPRSAEPAASATSHPVASEVSPPSATPTAPAKVEPAAAEPAKVKKKRR